MCCKHFVDIHIHVRNTTRSIKPDELLVLADLLDRDIEFFIDPFAVAGEAQFSRRVAPEVPEDRLDRFGLKAGRWIGLLRWMRERQDRRASVLKRTLRLTARSSFNRNETEGLLASLCGPFAALATGLNDTGQSLCYDGSTLVACTDANTGDVATYPRQDGRHGRDASEFARRRRQGRVGEAGPGGRDRNNRLIDALQSARTGTAGGGARRPRLARRHGHAAAGGCNGLAAGGGGGGGAGAA
jgi:hypothetical protein